MLVLFLLVWPDKKRGKVQSRDGALFYVIVIPVIVWTAVLCLAHATRLATLIGIALT